MSVVTFFLTLAIFGLLVSNYGRVNAQSGGGSNNRATSMSVPAEWRVRQKGTWVGWPIFEVIPGKPVVKPVCDMLSYLTNSGPNVVYLAVVSAAQETLARNTITAYNAPGSGNTMTIRTERIIYVQMRRTDFWMRDYTVFGWNSTGGLTVANYEFNAWGMGGSAPSPVSGANFLRVSNYFNSISNSDTNLAPKIATYLGIPMVSSWLTTEPGGLEFNDGPSRTNGGGKNRKRLIVSEAILTQPERNYGSTIYQILDELNRVHNLDEIILLPKFRYDAVQGREIMVPSCPMDITVAQGDLLRWGHCLDYTSSYYTDNYGGGVVPDDSVFSGSIDNIDTPERRALLGFSDPVYNNVLTALTTNGHTDEFVRWVDENTVLLAYVPNGGNLDPKSVDGRTWFRLEQIRLFLISKGIDIIRIPTPPEHVEYLGPGACAYDSVLDMYFTGGTYYDPLLRTRVDATGVPILSIYPKGSAVPFYSARSYLNWIVTDSYVLMPRYGDDPALDTEAFNIMKQVFASVSARTGINRTVVQIDNIDRLNLCGGGMHCITQNQPLPLN